MTPAASADVTARDLAGMSKHALMNIMLTGHAIDADALDDTEYRGVSLGLPWLFERVTWKTFVKAFHRDPQTNVLRGWNLRIRQRRPADYEPMMRRGLPVTFGHFVVVSARGRVMPRPCDRGLLLDYGLGARRLVEPTAALRDPIVAVNAGSSELLLGWSYLQLGRHQVPTPSFFSLERAGRLTYVPRLGPPRRA